MRSAFLLSCALMAACDRKPSSPVTITVADRKDALAVFQSRCVTCHGAKGAGDGPASAGLSPRPRNFQDAAWQGGISDGDLEKIIRYGGAAAGKSVAMPPNPDLQPGTIAALREHVRSLKK